MSYSGLFDPVAVGRIVERWFAVEVVVAVGAVGGLIFDQKEALAGRDRKFGYCDAAVGRDLELAFENHLPGADVSDLDLTGSV